MATQPLDNHAGGGVLLRCSFSSEVEKAESFLKDGLTASSDELVVRRTERPKNVVSTVHSSHSLGEGPEKVL